MPDFDFDLLTLGAGSGGVAASRSAALLGGRVAVCEQGQVGGTCVIRGCVPKKLLVFGAEYRQHFEDAAGFGWRVETPCLDWSTLQAKKNREIDRLSGLYARGLREAGVAILEGRGHLVDAHTLKVGGRRYSARHLLIATGARPRLANVPGIEHAITSNEALLLPVLPKRLVILGGGYIAAEFAGIFAGLGAKVTVLVREQGFLRGFDDDVRATLAAEMRKQGVDLREGILVEGIAKCAAADAPGSAAPLRVYTWSGETFECDTLLCATGRAPNTAGLGLAESGVKLDEDAAVVVDEFSRTTVDTIWAVGDCTNRVNLTPIAIAEGRALAETLFGDRPTRVDHRDVPTAIFSQPPVAAVGLSEAEAQKTFDALDIYITHFRPLRHALSGRDAQAIMKLVVDRGSQRVVGCHMVGDGAPEILQGLAVAMRCGATKAQFDATIGIHPTMAEEFVTMRTPSGVRPMPSNLLDSLGF